MRGVNKVIIVGNLGADPEVKHFQNGGSVTSISVATSEQWNDKQTGERREATEWHRIQFGNKLAEIAAQYLRKGSSVYIEGKIKTRKYQDQSGQERYITEIHAHELQMLGGGNGGNNNQGGYQQNQQPQNNGYQPQANNAYAQQMAQQAQQQFNDNPFMNGQSGNGGQFMQSNVQNPTMPQGMQAPKAGAVDDDVPF